MTNIELKKISPLQQKLMEKIQAKKAMEGSISHSLVSPLILEKKKEIISEKGSEKIVKNFQEAIEKVNADYVDARHLVPFFIEEYEKTSDQEKKLDSLFYWLIALLRSSVTESQEANKKYKDFLKEFEKTKKYMFDSLKTSKGDKITAMTVNLFIKKYKHNLSQLSAIYSAMGISDYVNEMYVIRQDLDLRFYWINKKILNFCFHGFDRMTSLYGISPIYLSVHVLVVSVLYAFWLFLLDSSSNTDLLGKVDPGWSDYFFTSVAVLSNLGAKITPSTVLENLTFIGGAIYGLIIFGLIMSLIGGRKQ